MSFLQIIDEMFGCFAYEWKHASLGFVPGVPAVPLFRISR